MSTVRNDTPIISSETPSDDHEDGSGKGSDSGNPGGTKRETGGIIGSGAPIVPSDSGKTFHADSSMTDGEFHPIQSGAQNGGTKREQGPVISSSDPDAGTFPVSNQILSTTSPHPGSGPVKTPNVKAPSASDAASPIQGSGRSSPSLPQYHFSMATGPITLNGSEYQIQRCLAKSGESEVFLIDRDGQKKVLKLYYSIFKPKEEIVAKLIGLKHPDILGILESGYHQDRFFEISQFAEGGSLMDWLPIRDLKALEDIVAETVNAFQYCHQQGIIHRDIKPHNLFFLNPDRTDLVVGDFGISSILDEGFSRKFTSRSRTQSYAAPEYSMQEEGRTILGKEVDYYAFGVTLIQAWTGKDPFENVNELTQMNLKLKGLILIPGDLPANWQTLIKGLLTMNPQQRWGYEEVQKWLKGETVPLHFKTVEIDYPPYTFDRLNNLIAANPMELAVMMERDPDKGKRQLYTHMIEPWLKPVDQDLCSLLRSVTEDELPRDKDSGLIKAIYLLDPVRSFRGHDGTLLPDKEAMAAHFEKHFDHYKIEFQNPNASFYLFLEARNKLAEANLFRKFFGTVVQNKPSRPLSPGFSQPASNVAVDKRSSSGMDLLAHFSSWKGSPQTGPGASDSKPSEGLPGLTPEGALNQVIFILQGANRFVFQKSEFFQPEELLKLDVPTHLTLAKMMANPEAKISIWLTTCFPDYNQGVNHWRSLGRFDHLTFRYALKGGFQKSQETAKDKAEFYQLFKRHFEWFFDGSDSEAKMNEADYWLKNYAGASLFEILVEFFERENLDDLVFLSIFPEIFIRCSVAGLSLYDLIQRLLPKVQETVSPNGKIFAAKVVVSRSIQTRLEEASKKNPQFIEELQNLVAFLDKQYSKFSTFFDMVFAQLDTLNIEGIRNDVKNLRGKNLSVSQYHSQLKTLSTRLQALGLKSMFCSWLEKVFSGLDIKEEEIREDCLREEQLKKEAVEEQFGKILEDEMEKVITASRKEFYTKSALNIVTLLGALFFLYLYQMNSAELISFSQTSSFRGVFLIVGVIIGCVAGGHAGPIGLVIGGFFGYQAGGAIFEGIFSSHAYVQIILVVMFLWFLFTSGALYLFLKNRDTQLAGISLPQTHMDAFRQGLARVEKHVSDKFAVDFENEIYQILFYDPQTLDSIVDSRKNSDGAVVSPTAISAESNGSLPTGLTCPGCSSVLDLLPNDSGSGNLVCPNCGGQFQAGKYIGPKKSLERKVP